MRGERHLAALKQQTNETRSLHRDIAIVWALHLPPTESCPSILKLIRSRVLEDAAEQLLFSCCWLAICTGGTSHAKPILCAGTMLSSRGDDSNWFHYIEINVNGGRKAGLPMERCGGGLCSS